MPGDSTQNADFSERIRGVLDARDMTTRALQIALEEAGADNSGYTSVRRYVKGEFPPSVAWVEAAATILEVTPASLAFGGSPTARKGMKAFFVGGPMLDDPPAADAIRAASSPAAALTGGAYFVGEDIMLAITNALTRAQPHGAPKPTEKDLAKLASRLSFAVSGILGATRRDAPGTVLAGAALGILAAVLAYVPARGQGRRVTDVTNMLPTPPKARRGDSDVQE